ncbi:MAG TPA: hypothetical protein VHY22_02635 [Chthoniobacteraceae bacterium]|jgi:hypothetical protein|nr:hypothetical protein [Chthoniobacteraceae bacterium]
MTPSEQFIESEIPPSVRLHFPKVIQTAYGIVREIRREHRWLAGKSVVEGHMRAWAVDFGFSQLIESGKWTPRKVDWPKYPNETGAYLRIFTQNAVVTVSQLVNCWEPPRKALFRDNARFLNERYLFEYMEPERVNDMGHLIIGHGYQQLSFVQVAMPHPENRHAWLASSRNILNELHDASSDLAPVEEVAADTAMQIKSDLLKRLSENAG